MLCKSIKEYTNPEQLSGNISEAMRRQKEEEKNEREELTKIVQHELPRASEEVINATVLRRMYENVLSKHDAADPELTGRPNCVKTLKSVKTKKWHHNGKYESNKFENNKMAWSCCMAEDQEGQGCVATIVDKQKWELSSFNS